MSYEPDKEMQADTLYQPRARRITDFENYIIYSDGRVFNERTQCWLKHSMAAGYPRVQLAKNGKKHTKHIHRLLAEAFIPNPQNLPQVNHLDRDRMNFSLSNLEWCTQSDNALHAYRNGVVTHNKGVHKPELLKDCMNCSKIFVIRNAGNKFCSRICFNKNRKETNANVRLQPQ